MDKASLNPFVFGAGLPLWKPNGRDGAAGPSQQSEQRAQGTRHPSARNPEPLFEKNRHRVSSPGQTTGMVSLSVPSLSEQVHVSTCCLEIR